MKLDCLLIHVPQIRKKINQIMVMPMGLFPIASELNKSGFAARILHLGLRNESVPSFSLVDFLRKSGCKTAALDLHWHSQMYDVVKVCAGIKSALPDIKIVLGGYTASCFHDEIIRDLMFIDYVIRGDGEVPLVSLLKALKEGTADLASVPNLTWRGPDGTVKINEIAYCNTESNTADLAHTQIDLMLDRDMYFTDKVLYRDFTESEANSRDYYFNCFFYNPGKGCPVNCSFCGGGAQVQKSVFGRKNYFFYSMDKVIRDLRELKNSSVSTIRTCFDPDREKLFYRMLFDILKKENHSFRMIFDLWSLPDRIFLEKFSEAFTKDSLLVFSADCGSDEVRRKNKGFYSPNNEILAFARTCSLMGIRTHIYLSYGLPWEKKEDLEITADFIRDLKAAGANTSVAPMYLDPFSPIFLMPDKYRASVKCKTAADFYRAAKNGSAINYTSAFLSEEEIIEGCGYLSGLC